MYLGSLLNWLKYPITVAIIIMAVQTASKGFWYGLLALSAILIFAAYFVYREQIEFFLAKKGRKKFYWFESLASGGIKEAQIFRPLSPWEKQVLDWRFYETKNKNYDLDRRSPVFKVVGELLLQGLGKEKAEVRGLEITQENCSGLIFQRFGQNQEVVVEFSPFSKQVWDMYQLIVGRRIWNLGLPVEAIKQIRVGTKNIDLRASFGSHNLDKLKTGDYISYHDMVAANLVVEIVSVNHYAKLEEAIRTEGLFNIMPQAKTETDLIDYLTSLPSYLARVKQNGIYAIKLKLAS